MLGMNAHTGQSLSGLDHLRQSIADILSTPLNTRVMRRDYGSRLPELIDQPINNPKNLSYPTPFACSASKRCGFGGPIAARVRLRCAQQRSQTDGPSNCSAAALTQA